MANVEGLEAPNALREAARVRLALVDRVKRSLIGSLDLDMTPDEIDEDAVLFGVGMGLDSIDALQIVLGIESDFNVSLSVDDLTIYRSVNTLADHLMKEAQAELGALEIGAAHP